jgi:hypothetical protein
MNEIEQPQNELSYGQYQQPSSDYTSLKMRLDTEPMMLEIESFLRTIGKDGKQRINEYGVNSILSQLRLRFNTQVVQGNFYVDKHGFSEQYNKYMYALRISLTEHIINKRVDFGIDDTDSLGIIDSIMDCLETFSTRLLGNAERNSYNNTLQTKDTIVHSQQKGISKLFKQ